LKFEVGVAGLKAIAVSSDNGKHAVGAEELAMRLNLSPASAGLNNAFFTEVGLVTKEGRGRYKPTELALEFARKHTFDQEAAGKVLAPAFRTTWCFQEVQKQVAMEPRVTKDQMVQVLAAAAGATNDHRVQLLGILDWLQYAGVIEIKDDVVTVVPTDSATPDPAPAPVVPPAPEGAAAAGKGTTTQREHQAPQAAPVMSLSFELALTAEGLQRLSPEQITALFGAVGTIVAIKATAG